MKKAILISVGAYTAVCIGFGLWMLACPESYGRWLGKMTTGLFGEFEDK